MLTLEKWIDYGDAPTDDAHCLSWLGGWFNFNPSEEDQSKYTGKRWKDYLDTFQVEVHPYLEAVRVAIVANGRRFNGDAHQHQPGCVPLFSDGKVLCLSFRAWGDLMAAVWSEHEDKDYTYMDFYM